MSLLRISGRRVSRITSPISRTRFAADESTSIQIEEFVIDAPNVEKRCDMKANTECHPKTKHNDVGMKGHQIHVDKNSEVGARCERKNLTARKRLTSSPKKLVFNLLNVGVAELQTRNRCCAGGVVYPE